MEKQRFLLFFVLSMGILIVWTNFVAPVWFPPPPAPDRDVAQNEAPAPNGDPKAPKEPDGEADLKPQPEANAGQENPERNRAEAPLVADEPPPEIEKNKPLVADWDPAKIAIRSFKLGSLDPETGYFMEVELTTEGGGVSAIALSDPRYKDLENPKHQLYLINPVEGVAPSLATAFLSEQPKDPVQSLSGALVTWDVARDEQGRELIESDPDHPKLLKGVTFRCIFQDLGLEVLKTYRLEPSAKTGDDLIDARTTELSSYELQLEIAIRNLTDQPQRAVYLLQGPVGLPLENKDNTRKYRDIAMGFIEPTGAVRGTVLTSAGLVEMVDENPQESWTSPFRYMGIDLQYFSALLVPDTDQSTDQQIAFVKPMLARRERDANHSDISLVFGSRELELQAGGTELEGGQPADRLTHSFKLFVGPKREELLDPLEAGSLLNYGTMGALAGVMLWILNGLNGIGFPYWIAIIILTMIVRGCLFPLSKKQVIGAQKMKELQPKLQELKKKYGKDKEKMARAQMELFRKHNYNPLAGCLPLVLQLPIFISLYTALSTSVDLRLAPFLWANNLAAPDALFQLPFALPFLGRDFNLLPILTIVLFIVQQKMFMPPPTSEEQVMQQKMMKVMMVFMGFLFYHVPAGLCIYFIASSLWGIGERKMLDVYKTDTPPQPATAPAKK